jgi:hypothetical protein
MPLPAEPGMVSPVPQYFRHGYTTAVKETPVTEKLAVKGMFVHRRIGHVPYAGLMGMESRHKAGPGGTATGNVVKLGVKLPVCGKFINIRGIYLPAKASRIGISHVVGEYYYYVRPFIHNISRLSSILSMNQA